MVEIYRYCMPLPHSDVVKDKIREAKCPHLWSETVSDMDSRDSDFKPRRNGGEDFTKEYYFKHEGHFTELAPELAVHYGIGMNVSEICGVHLNRVSQWVDAWLSQQ